jgi:flagellar basal-body rod protein FlgC
MDAYDISASGMSAQRLRLDVIASNLANINTTRQADGSVGPYRRRNVVFASMLQQSMGSSGSQNTMPMKPSSLMMHDGERSMGMDNGIPTLKASISANPDAPTGVQVVGIAEDTQTPLKMVYEPNNPDADAKGYVAMPNINPVTEMVDMISASRAYEANVTGVQATKSMDKASLDI